MKIILILLALFACLRFVCSNRLKTVFYQLPSPKIQQPVRLALLTDLHSCLYGSKQQKLLHAIQKQQPALILFAGDIYDDKYPGINTDYYCRVYGTIPAFTPAAIMNIVFPE